jgi:Flp pilus assembly protein TadD
MLQVRRSDIVLAAAVLAGAAPLLSHLHMTVHGVHAAETAPASIAIDYPSNGSVFPPEITPPTFLWRDASEAIDRWRIEIRFSDGGPAMVFESTGPRMSPGEVDPRCFSANNEPPKLTPEQAAAHTWKPDAANWEKIKKRSVAGPAKVFVEGIRASDTTEVISSGQISMETSQDPVGAPIFYRDVPLMPSEGEKGLIKPLASNAIHLIQWRLKSIDQPGSRVVLDEMHTCANCHSFSRDGKTLGIDMDGPQNDKGLYAAVALKPQTVVRTEDMIKWNPSQDPRAAFNRVGFMSQVSPDGRYVLTMLGSPERPPENRYFVANFKDYRFLQVFYPTRGVLYWYDRTTGKRQPLPGAADPDYVQTNGVWSPDGKYIVFARAKAVDPYPPGRLLAARANDPNEIPIQYDLYRIPFNDGRGGKVEPITGASANGMSNSFPKVSPDGKWIVFVEARNGEVMRPDGKLYIVPAGGGEARRLNANMSPMNSWHSWSPNGRWLVFSSKSRGPYTKMFLTHIDENGNDTPAILIDNATAANRAVNLPEFVNIRPNGLLKINTPVVEMYAKFDHAAELGTEGKDAQAIGEWRELSASNPDDERVWNNLGAALTRMGQYGEAVEDFEKALALNPQYALVHGNLARALDGAGRDEDAMREYQKAVEAEPDSAELHVNLGRSLEKHGYGDLALREFERAVELQPDSAEGHNELGLALLAGGESKNASQAEEEFRKAIASNPHYAEAANNLGTLYGESGRDREAEAMFRAALHDAPEMTKAMVNLGATLASESKFAEAEAVVEGALKLEPENKEVLELLRMIQRAHGQAGGERK